MEVPYDAAETRTPIHLGHLVASLLRGGNSCEWAIWFKAHYQSWIRQLSGFDQAQWLLDHTALVNERIRNWEVGGSDVDLERQDRDAGWPTRPHRPPGRRSGGRGRQGLLRQPQPCCPCDDLLVRRSQGTQAVQERQIMRTGHLLGPHGPHPCRRGRRQVHPEFRCIDPPARSRRTCKAGAQQARMPVLRYQRRRLPRMRGRRIRDRRWRNRRFLKGSRRRQADRIRHGHQVPIFRTTALQAATSDGIVPRHL